MKAKTIKRMLNAKFETFVKSIKDDNVQRAVRANTIITGGAIVSMLLNEDVNDFDLYFRDAETTKLVAEYYFKKMDTGPDDHVKYSTDENTGEERVQVFIQSRGVLHKKQKDNENKFLPRFITDNAITLTDKIQIVLRFFGEPEVIHSNYDFVHATCFWTAWNNALVLPPAAIESILTKELRYTGSKFPICSVIRLRKFIARGWHINAGQLMKILFQVAKLNLEDINVLREQLVGVDATYFCWFIEELKKAQDEGVEITDNYLAALMEEIFDKEPEPFEADEDGEEWD